MPVGSCLSADIKPMKRSSLILFSLTGLLLPTGCDHSPPPSVSKEPSGQFQLTINQTIARDTNRLYALSVHSDVPIKADLNVGSNFYSMPDSKPGSNDLHRIVNVRIGAHRTSTNSGWHLEHTSIKTGTVSAEGTHSVRIDAPFDETILLTATNGSYPLGKPLRLGNFYSKELNITVAKAEP